MFFLLVFMLFGWELNESSLLFEWTNGSHDRQPKNDSDVALTVRNIRKSQGTIWIGLYDSEASFLVKEKAIVKGYPVEQIGDMIISLPDVSYGTYAVALFHDLNDNGVLDQNVLGVPREPYAFSGELQSQWRLPSFSEVKHTFSPERSTLTLKLDKWRAW